MLTALDIVVLVLIGGGAVLGGLRGFVTEILSLFAWAAAVFALKLLHTPATGLLTGITGTQGGAAVLAFVLIFGATFFGGKLVAASLGRRTRKSVLGPVDRLLGIGFGALKGLLIATLLFLGVNLGYDTVFGGTSERPVWLKTSRTYPLLNASGRAIVDFVKMRRGQAVAPAGSGQRRLTGALYNTAILRLAASIPHQARLAQAHATVEKRSPVCGSRVTVDVALGADGRVAAIGQEVRACALGQASAALMAAHAIGRSPEELAGARNSLGDYLAGRRDDLGTWPGLDIFAPARPHSARHSSIRLAFEAVAEAAATAAAARAPA